MGDLPDGLFPPLGVQPSPQKDFASLRDKISSISAAFRPEGGTYRDRHERGTECDGRIGIRRRRVLMRTAKPCGLDASTLALSW
jgi:hypothetical protein